MPRYEETPLDETTSAGRPDSPAEPEIDGGPLADQPASTAEDASRKVRESASEYAEQGRDQVESRLREQKIRLSGQLGSMSEALRAANQQLYEHDQATIARYVDDGVEQIDHLARFLEERDIGEIFSEVESFARERPAIFLGGAFGLGVLASRFLKSSGQQSAMSHD